MKKRIYILLFGLFLVVACQNNQPKEEAWITFSYSQGLKLFGKKMTLEELKPALKDKLSKMSILPEKIPIQYKGEILMGMRGEIETIATEALEEVQATREK